MTENEFIENEPTKVYIKTDSSGNVTAVNSSIFLSDSTVGFILTKGMEISTHMPKATISTSRL